MQDAHNLAWKLAGVCAGWAPESLLETFEQERRPVARTNADQSLKNALRLFEVAQALGVTDFSPASHARMQRTLATAEGLRGVEQAIARQAEHFDMPGLQLGFCYGAGALLRGEGDEPPGAGDPRRFVPSGCPGARVPHAWVVEHGARASLLDWVPLDRLLLLAGPDGQAWIDALAAIEGPPVAGRRLAAGSVAELDRWLALAGIEAPGALLVRPDQHVAWRARRGAADPARELARAVEAVLRGS